MIKLDDYMYYNYMKNNEIYLYFKTLITRAKNYVNFKIGKFHNNQKKKDSWKCMFLCLQRKFPN